MKKYAWSSYDPEMTVTKAKWLRLWEIKKELMESEETISKIKNNWSEWTEIVNDDTINNTEETKDIETQNEENITDELDEISEENIDEYIYNDTQDLEDTENEETIKENWQNTSESITNILEFEVPATTWEIKKLKEILSKYPWDIKIKIGTIDKTISKEWLKELQNLLVKNQNE